MLVFLHIEKFLNDREWPMSQIYQNPAKLQLDAVCYQLLWCVKVPILALVDPIQKSLGVVDNVSPFNDLLDWEMCRRGDQLSEAHYHCKLVDTTDLAMFIGAEQGLKQQLHLLHFDFASLLLVLVFVFEVARVAWNDAIQDFDYAGVRP